MILIVWKFLLVYMLSILNQTFNRKNQIFSYIHINIGWVNYIWVISPIIDKRLYLTLFDLATTSWVFTIT